ncbi:MAG: ACT domain-containing protein [Oscillospiraceae bacterium]|nr:ACT domain-containing protein [Oscillospiraceae bacterium]
MTIEQLSIFLENKPGKLVEALETLREAKIDLRALSLADTADFGILRVIVDKPGKALEVLQEEGYLVRSSEVLPIAVSDKPGGLSSVLRILADAGADVEYAYAFVAHSHDMAYVIIRVNDNAVAEKALKDNGIQLLSPERVYGM